jgi:hypothetical protein
VQEYAIVFPLFVYNRGIDEIWHLLFENSSIILKEIDLDSNHVLSLGIWSAMYMYVLCYITNWGEFVCIQECITELCKGILNLVLKIDIAVDGINVMSKSGDWHHSFLVHLWFICSLVILLYIFIEYSLCNEAKETSA